MKISRILTLVLILCCCLPAAHAEEAKSLTLMGFEPDGNQSKWENSLFFPRMAERTGVSFELNAYADAVAYQAAKDAVFASGNLPDVLFKASLSPEEEMRYFESGQLIDLSPYLEEYAPNIFKILQARPDWRDIITQPSGAITSLPVLSGAERQCCIWINRTWLSALGLDMPTTIDEYTQVLRAFRDQDPNLNGKQDEVPLSLIGAWEAKFLLHAFGIVSNDYNIYLDQGGTVRCAPFESGFRSFVEWLCMAQAEGLIGPDAFRQFQSSRSTAMADENAEKTLGGLVSIAPYTIVDMGQTTEYEVLMPLAYEGRQAYRELLNGIGRGTFAVTSACGDIAAALRWVDYLYTEEGGRLAFAGLEGEDYSMGEDGMWSWTSGEDYSQLSQIVERSIISGDSQTPGLEPAAFLRNSEITDDNYARRQVDAIRAYLVYPYPVTWPTDAAREARINELQMALGAYIDTSIANFAQGITELNDDTWLAFEKELRSLGAEEFTALWQEKADELKR